MADNDGASDRQGDGQATEVVQDESTTRPWLAPAIALSIAIIVLILLLIPGFLVYPEKRVGPADRSAALETQRDVNRSLQERIDNLKETLDGDACIADGRVVVPGEGSAGGTSSGDPGAGPLSRPAIPAPPESQAVPDESLPDDGIDERPNNLVEMLDAAAVLVIVENQGIGTGFFVSPNTVLTNHHVVGDSPQPAISIASQGLGRAVSARLVARTPSQQPGSPDYALLEVDETAPLFLSFHESANRLDEVVAAGFPGMILETDARARRLLAGDLSSMPTLALTEGIVTASQPGNQTEVILHTAQVTPGNSGGPLVDRCGRVLAVNTFVRAEETAGRMNYALDARSAIAFLEQNGISARRVTSQCVPQVAESPSGSGSAEAPDEMQSEEGAGPSGEPTDDKAE